MSSSDFWNLAGRAGRWGKEFQGNIICVDARRRNVWPDGAPTSRSKFQITRTTDGVLSQVGELLEYIDAGTPRTEARQKPQLEYVFSYLMSAHIRHGGIEDAPWAQRFPAEVIKRISEIVEVRSRSLSTPNEVILRNPGISPIAMDRLLEYFLDRTENRKEAVEDLLPVLPESDDAVNVYAIVLHRINRHLGDVFGRGNRVRQLALLIVDWMRGYPLARIISSRETHYGSDNLARLIRDSMKDVEEIARFQAPKFLACYVDLLRVYLDRIDRQDLVARLFDLNILLEFGVSHPTQLSLMGLGLSRSSSIALSELIMDDSLSEEECLVWLRDNDWMRESMPRLLKQEIGRLLDSREEEGPRTE